MNDATTRSEIWLEPRARRIRAGRVLAPIFSLAVLLAGVAGASAATTSPMLSAIYASNNNSQDIYYESPSGSLQEVSFTNQFLPPRTWPGAGPLYSAPSAVYASNNSSQNVYYEGPGGSLQEASFTNQFLPPRTWPGAGPLYSAPSAIYDSGNKSQNVYYEGPGGSLQEVAWTPSTGFGHPLTVVGAGSLASAPAATYDPHNNSQDVYYETPNGSLQEVAWTPSTGFKHPITVLGAGSLALPPTAPDSTPVTTGPTTPGSITLSPPARPHHPRRRLALRVKILLHWRWNGRRTQLTGIAFRRLPRRTKLTISCRGRGCPRRGVSAGALRYSDRLVTLPGPVYRAGDRLRIKLSAPNFAAERAEVWVRNGRIPVGRLI